MACGMYRKKGASNMIVHDYVLCIGVIVIGHIYAVLPVVKVAPYYGL